MQTRRALASTFAPIALGGFFLLLGRGCADSPSHPPGGTSLPKAPAAAAPVDKGVVFHQTIDPLLTKYCYECHGQGKHEGDVALDTYPDVQAIEKETKVWQAVSHHLRSGQMPPPDADAKPTPAERRLIANWVDEVVYHFDPSHPDPGRVTLRRMNRAEYNNAIRDLVGVDFQPAADFPPDDSGYGFDNIGDVLSMPPSLLEKYLAAAGKVVDQAVVTDAVAKQVRHLPASIGEIANNSHGDRGDGWVEMISIDEDPVSFDVSMPAAGDYLIRVFAYSSRTGGFITGGGGNVSERGVPPGPLPPMKLSIVVDGTTIKDVTPVEDENHPGVCEARIGIPAGMHRVEVYLRRKRTWETSTLTEGRLGPQQAGLVMFKWLEVEGPLPCAMHFFPASQLSAPAELKRTSDGGRVLEHANQEISLPYKVATEGDYIVRVTACANFAGAEPPNLQLRLDGKALKDYSVEAPARVIPLQGQRPDSLSAWPGVYETQVHLLPGESRFSVALTNEFADPANPNPNRRVRSLEIRNMQVVGLAQPVVRSPVPNVLREMLTENHIVAMDGDTTGDPLRPRDVPADAAARGLLADFARRAWRRPTTPAEIDRLMALEKLAINRGASFSEALKLSMKAALVSPNFLFINLPPSGAPAPATAEPLDEIALASRLSFFLWSSIPDEELLSLAEHGQLRRNLEPQVRRMLASPKSHALVENFAGQWLQVRALESFEPDKKTYPDFDPSLRNAMKKETDLFVDYILRNNRSVTEFLTADYTFVNERLAKFYGLPGVSGDEFVKVSLAGTPRRGLLTQGSVLLATSNPTRTSPVKRGKWVLENLLGTPPSPPPPNVPALDDATRQLTGTVRQQMVAHRADPNCASCHAMMDPIGFGLEHFNGIGAWRDNDGKDPIDSTGELISGENFNGAAELVKILAGARRDDFLGCLTEKLLTYSLGRGVEYYDRPTVDQIVQHLETNGDTFANLVVEITGSYPFQNRRGESSPPPGPQNEAVKP